MRLGTLILTCTILLAATPAATAVVTYDNSSSQQGGLNIESSGTQSMGQVFTAPAGRLLSWTFYNWYDDQDLDDQARIIIARWDGAKAVGPALYDSDNLAVAHVEAFEYTADDINLDLVDGASYIAIFSLFGLDKPIRVTGMRAANLSPLGGFLTYPSMPGAPLEADIWLSPTSPKALQYKAQFETAVPEPGVWAIMVVGLGLAGAALRRPPMRT